MQTRAPTKLSTFTVTVRDWRGRHHSWPLKAKDLEEAAQKAARKCSLKRGVKARRTSGKVGEPGWFYPQIPGPWPFGGNSYYVEEKKP